MIVNLPFWALLSKVGLSKEHQPYGFAGFEALVCLFVGVLVGACVARWKHSFVSTGRWIWVLPAAIILPDIVRIQFRPSGVPWLSEYLFASEGEGLGVFFLTLGLSATGYSIGMAVPGIRSLQTHTNRLRSVIRIAWLSAGGVAVFALFAFTLHRFEQRSLTRWARVRLVIERPGLQFSPDPQSLCAPGRDAPARNPAYLRSGAHVEYLGHLACDQNQLLDGDSLPPPKVGEAGPILLDRVRILEGPSAGTEGWVLEYGLN